MKDFDEPRGTARMVVLGACEICGNLVIVARWVDDICPVPITTCSRECGEKAADNRNAMGVGA